MARRSVGRDRSQRHARRRRLRRSRSGDGAQVLRRRDRSAAVKLFLTFVGYTERGWIYWERAAWFAPDRIRRTYEDLASYQLIASNLAGGNPVIVRVRLARRVISFVVVA